MNAALFRWLMAGLVFSSCLGNMATASNRLVRIVTKAGTRVGTVVAHNQEIGWFEERDGRLTAIPLGDVSDYHVLGSFQPFGAVELREQLAREFGREFQIASTGHYLVVSSNSARPQSAALFEELYRQFVVTFAARGFRMKEPEFPLIAIVFPNEAQFHDYCRQEGVKPMSGLRGYYMPSSNRVALYETSDNGRSTLADLDHTILHEAVHQVAFNTGIHSRIGENPQWVIEGLATAMEVDAVRRNDRTLSIVDRVNVSRYRWFVQHQKRWPAGYVGRLVSTDDPFHQSTLDAYAQSWALTFYLLEARSADYTGYLRLVSKRDHGQPYSAEDRLRDFQTAFGPDVSLIETRLNRFIEDVAASSTLNP